ncbi:13599_t:CDS:2 [Gigaspora rosea]|nr:13599_t:CDS:2 [Gigaspora rosea]
MDSPHRILLLYTGLYIYYCMNLELHISGFFYFMKNHHREIIAVSTIPTLAAMYDLYTFATVIITTMFIVAVISVFGHYQFECIVVNNVRDRDGVIIAEKK